MGSKKNCSRLLFLVLDLVQKIFMGKTVGIDLGTTNSLVAYVDPQTGKPKCIPGPYGSTLCPSVVSVDPDGSIIVGEPARRRLLTQPERSIYSVKRLMGSGPADVHDE